MARHSKQIDQALLRSGRALFPATGCAALSIRAVAEHAGVNVGMFYYHFKTKDNFLRALLQETYEEMFATLSGQVDVAGTAHERLRAALTFLALFVRKHRGVIARVWIDTMAGEAVTRDFFRANAPRHVGLLFGLLEQVRAEGGLREQPPVQAFAFAMGAVLMPMIFAAGLVDSGVAPDTLQKAFDSQVMSDSAIEQRVDLALLALGSDGPLAGKASMVARGRGGTSR